MPYAIHRVKGGFKVVEKKGGKHPGRTFSKRPQTEALAERQRAAIYMNSHAK